MASVYDADQSDLVEKAAEQLKKIESIKPPQWAPFVKTGTHKERSPQDKDWWYKRAASILRRVYRFGPIGVAKLRTKYGGKKNRGVKPERFYKGSGNIIRKVLQQLEKAELISSDLKSKRRGRVITPKGKSLLDKIATSLVKGTGRKPVVKVKPAKKVEKKETKPKVEKSEEKKQEPKKEVSETPKDSDDAKESPISDKPETKQEKPKAEQKKEEVKTEEKPKAEDKPEPKQVPKEEPKPEDNKANG